MQSSWILLVLFTALLTVNGQISQLPLNVTAKIGGNVTLRCGVDDPNVYTEWLEFITTSTGNVIFNSQTGVFDPNKYAIEGTFNLMIKNLELRDGGYYGCKVAGMRSPVRADVVIIEEPEPYSEPLYEGDIALMMCTTRYQSASHDQITPSHIPKAEAYIYDDVRITDAETIQYPEFYETRIRMNYSAAVSDNGKDLTCRIYTADPVYEDMAIMPLDVKFPVHNLQFAPRNEFYYVGEYVNCTAEGNPTAEYEWIPELSDGGAKVYQSTLHIISTMVGANIWTCYARNTAKEPIAINGEISFEVYPDDSGSGEVGPGPATAEAWVIAVAVIVPLAVIAVIVVLIVVFLVKKRKAPASDKPKPVQSNPNFEESSSSTDENYPENYANGKPKPPAMKQQAKPQPQPQMTTPGYSMNPAGRVGYLPPNHPHNRSPGYADLGIKHIPAYAQPPSLNSSLDHNIGGGQPNGVNRQNLNINPNPYSRAPIVMARPENPPMASMNQKRLASLSGSMASLGSETGV